MIYKTIFNSIYGVIFGGLIVFLLERLIVIRKFDFFIVWWIIAFLALGFFACFIQLCLSLYVALDRNKKLDANNKGLMQDRAKHLEDKKELSRENDDLRFKLITIYQNYTQGRKSINETHEDSTNNRQQSRNY